MKHFKSSRKVFPERVVALKKAFHRRIQFVQVTVTVVLFQLKVLIVSSPRSAQLETVIRDKIKRSSDLPCFYLGFLNTSSPLMY